jgi:hypothetical protein
MSYHLPLSDVTGVTSERTAMGNKQQSFGKPVASQQQQQQPVPSHATESTACTETLQSDLACDKLTEDDSASQHVTDRCSSTRLDNTDTDRALNYGDHTETSDVITSDGDAASAVVEHRNFDKSCSSEPCEWSESTLRGNDSEEPTPSTRSYRRFDNFWIVLAFSNLILQIPNLIRRQFPHYDRPSNLEFIVYIAVTEAHF